MAPRKLKTVFTADAEQVRRIRAVVQQSRRYRSVSELLREAIDEKLERLRRESLGAQVDRYCREGHGDEDVDLIEGQAFTDKR